MDYRRLASILFLLALGVAASSTFATSSLEETTVRVEPIYPEEALNQCIEGYVQLEFTVTVEGRVANVVVIDSDPPGLFEEAAIKSMERWRFKPRLESSVVVPDQQVQATIRFDLEELGSNCCADE